MLSGIKKIWGSLSFRISVCILIIACILGYAMSKVVVMSLMGLTNTHNGLQEGKVLAESITNEIRHTENALQLASMMTDGKQLKGAQLETMVDSLVHIAHLPDAYILEENCDSVLEECKERTFTTRRENWSEVYLKTLDGQKPLPTVTCMVPLLAKDGNPYAVLCSDYQLVYQEDPFGEEDNSWVNSTTLYYNIVDSRGIYICHWDSAKVFQKASAGYEDDGVQSAAMHNDIAPLGWKLNYHVHMMENNEQTFIVKVMIYVFTGVLILVLGLCIIFIVRWQTRPLRQITAAADAVAKGDFQAQLPKIFANTEIKRLRDSFFRMQLQLSQYIEDLKFTTQRSAVMEHDIEVAAEVQQNLLPKSFVKRKDLDIYGFQKPARLVGGDLFDYFLHEGKLFFCIGDVSGKGVPASLMMTVVVHLFRNVGHHTSNPAEITGAINQELAEGNKKCMFCTLFTGVIDLETKKMEYCNAGHNTPLFIQGEEVKYLKMEADIAVGVFASYNYQVQQMQLTEGDCLFLYTDGVTEAQDLNDEYMGEDRLQEAVSSCPLGADMRQLTDHILTHIEDFTGGAEQNDDITILSIRV